MNKWSRISRKSRGEIRFLSRALVLAVLLFPGSQLVRGQTEQQTVLRQILQELREMRTSFLRSNIHFIRAQSLLDQIRGNQERILNIERDVNVFEQEVSSTEESKKELEEKITEAEAAVQQQTESDLVSFHEENVKDLKQLYDRVTERADEIKQKLYSLRATLEEERGKLNGLRADLTALERNLLGENHSTLMSPQTAVHSKPSSLNTFFNNEHLSTIRQLTEIPKKTRLLALTGFSKPKPEFASASAKLDKYSPPPRAAGLIDCPSPYLKPVFNVYPVSYAANEIPVCNDFPLIDLAKDAPALRWSRSVLEHRAKRYFKAGDVIVIGLFLINGARPTSNGESIARNVEVTSIISRRGRDVILSVTYSSADGETRKESITFSIGKHEEVYPVKDSTYLFGFNGANKKSLPNPTARKFKLRLGDVKAGVENSSHILYRLKVVGKK